MEFTFKLDESATGLVLAALSKMPYEQSAMLIHGIQEEARRQVAAKQAADAADAPDATDAAQLPAHADAAAE